MSGVISSLVATALFLVGSFLYSTYYPGHTEALRATLRKQSEGRKRRKYVRIFVEAIKGVDKSDLITHAGKLSILMPFVLLFAVFFAWLNSSDTGPARLNATQDEMKIARMGGPDEMSKKEAHERLQSIEQSEKHVDLYFYTYYFHYLVCPIFAAILAVMLVKELQKGEFMEYRARFAHELERFTLRIQGLATKDELAELVTKEVAVKDEATAKEFVDVMAKIAAKHKVDVLVESFLLWGEPSTPPAAPEPKSP